MRRIKSPARAGTVVRIKRAARSRGVSIVWLARKARIRYERAQRILRHQRVPLDAEIRALQRVLEIR